MSAYVVVEVPDGFSAFDVAAALIEGRLDFASVANLYRQPAFVDSDGLVPVREAVTVIEVDGRGYRWSIGDDGKAHCQVVR
jgi:hypothetical protein